MTGKDRSRVRYTVHGGSAGTEVVLSRCKEEKGKCR